MECYASLSRRANDILKAIGGNIKWDYADSISQALTPEKFSLHKTFHHGFPSQPTCLAYDSVQQLLAIGTEKGAVLLLGMPGLERWLFHPTEVPIRQMLFITNKGLLITNGDNETLYFWSLQGKSPSIVHKMEFRTELYRPTVISWTHGSKWMYVGTNSSYVYVVHTESFELSGYSIRWIKTCDVYQLDKPGDVVAVEEHPLDQGKVLIAYSRGMCVLWDLKSKTTEGRFSYNLSENHTLTSMCWLGNGKSFVCSYSDGCVARWNPAKPGNKPEKTFFPHESDHDKATFRPVNKVQSVNTDSGTWYICSGGLQEDSPSSVHSLTIKQRKSFSHLSTTSPIMDFLCLPSSPFPYDCQKPFALVILTKNELVVHDLQSSGYPTFNLPYALDVHLSPVTCVQYYENCPDEFIASLQSVNSKLIAENKSTEPWPLKGGKWGEEVYQMSTDLIVTGHVDGSVRFWFSNSVIFQPVFTVNTSRYFKIKHKAHSNEKGHVLQEHRMPNGSSQSQRKRFGNTRFPATGQHKAHSSTPRSIVQSVIQRKNKSMRPTTPLLEDESLPAEDEEFFAIQEISMCVHGLWMCVANVGGSVLTFDFKMGEVTTTPKSLEICFDHDSVFDLKGQPTCTSAATIPSGDWTLREGMKDSKPGFHLTQHCQCYYSSISETESLPVIVSSMQYSSDIGMLTIGADQGFTVVDTITNRCLYTFCNLTSILSAGMANPSKGSWKTSTPAAFDVPSPKPTVMKHANLQSMFTEYLRGAAHIDPMVECSAKTNLCQPALQQKVEENECSVTVLKVVQLQLEKQAPPTLTLWMGLASGHIAAYGVNIRHPKNVGFGAPQRILNIEVIPICFVHKSPIVSIHFLNEWGDQKMVPYKPPISSREQGYQRSSESHKPHYAIITDEKRIQSFSFPGFIPVGKVTPPIHNNAILMSEYFTCHDLPCLLSLTSCQHILVHSLPNLKPLLRLSFPLLSDTRVSCTFRVSANGQVFYMSSASEIQRMSLVKNDRLNLPACLPDVHIHLKDPQPVNRRKPKVVNKEPIFEGRKRLWSVTKRDSTPEQTPHTSASLRDVGGAAAPSYLNKELDKRKSKISAAILASEKLAQGSREFGYHTTQ